ncbi:ZCHC3 protein, partial [Polyodon spathula]|nr:ZCHC3 protein [Polyodon spathula]
SRLDFSRQILQWLLEVKPGNFNSLIKLPGIAVIFNVSFVSNGAMEKCLQVYNKKKKDAPLSQFSVEPLSDREIKVVTIQFYSEVVNDYDTETRLHRHCKVKSGSRKVNDADGVWNGARQWLIQLRKDLRRHTLNARHIDDRRSAHRGYALTLGVSTLDTRFIDERRYTLDAKRLMHRRSTLVARRFRSSAIIHDDAARATAALHEPSLPDNSWSEDLKPQSSPPGLSPANQPMAPPEPPLVSSLPMQSQKDWDIDAISRDASDILEGDSVEAEIASQHSV